MTPGGPEGPPGARIFSLDRPAPGLYLAAWVLALAATGLLAVGVQTGNATARAILILAGFIGFALAFGAGGGYQVIARSSRPAGAYRGPSPVIGFGFAVAVSSTLALLFDLSGVLAIQTPAGFFVGLLLVLAGYLATVTLLAVRTGVMTWADLAGSSRAAGRGALDFLVGVASGLVVVLPLAVLAGLLASALGVQGGDRIPSVASGADAAFVVLGVVLVAPIGEELFFRGFALNAWRADLGSLSALRRSSVFFALVHIANASGRTFGEALRGASVQFLVILPLAFLLGILYERRGLAASIGAHMAYNGGLLAVAILASRALGG